MENNEERADTTAKAFTVLVVDDDAYILDFVSRLLKDQGYRVFASKNASAAIGLMEENAIDIILSDIKMPDMSGLELLEKAHGINPYIPVVLMTAYAELDLAIDAAKKGAVDFITKPFKPDHLIRSVEKAAKHVALLRLEKHYKEMLEDDVRQRTRELGEANTALIDLNDSLILAFANAIDAKSEWTKGHSERVSIHAVSIAKEMGFDEKELEDLRIAALLHDIGKIGTYDVILEKPGRLTAEEFALVKLHPANGEKILRPIRQLRHILPAIRAHHEKMDGAGYPDGLKGEAIPLPARILCVADTFDAMTSDRPYRSAPKKEYAIAELKRCSGTQFDPVVAKAFLRILEGKCLRDR